MAGKITQDEIPIILKAEYNIKHNSNIVVKRKRDDYNKWRQSLPDTCWRCQKYDICNPSTECLHNPNYKNL